MVRFLLPIGFALALGTLLVIPNGVLSAQPDGAILPPPPPPPKAEEELVQKVRKAIDDGVRYLKKEQTKKGTGKGSSSTSSPTWKAGRPRWPRSLCSTAG